MLNFLFLVAADEEYLATILREKASLRQKRPAYILYRPLGDRLASPRKKWEESQRPTQVILKSNTEATTFVTPRFGNRPSY